MAPGLNIMFNFRASYDHMIAIFSDVWVCLVVVASSYDDIVCEDGFAERENLLAKLCSQSVNLSN